jgi:hypothetical protein
MTVTVTTICNKALAHLGEPRITDFHESSVNAEKCRDHYDLELTSLLRMHRWNFARDRETLAELDEAPAFGWERAFQLPSDCLRVLELNGNEVENGNNDAFEIEGRKLLTDAETASIIYTRYITDASQYDALFVEALSYKLAVALCKVITNSTSERGALMQFFKDAMAQAGWVDSVENRPRVISPSTDSPTLAARLGVRTRLA